jgi:transposase-like protein
MTDNPVSSQNPTEPAPASVRVRISCPGCGRNDYVSWPTDRETYHWKCFNCGKQFDLTRESGH